MPRVDLGFLEKCEPWRLESRLFPSKIGGKPAWLSLKELPAGEELICKTCQKVIAFLCQVYAPYDSQTDNENHNFHRSLFVFICRNLDCNVQGSTRNIKVFRSTLPRANDFYSFDPPEEKIDTTFDIAKWTELCNVCGILAHKRCSQCKNVLYCSRSHQIIDWKNGHKSNCLSEVKIKSPLNNYSKFLFPEWELVIETEELEKEVVNEQEAIEEYKKLQAEGKTGTLNTLAETDLDAHASAETDKIFDKFKKRTEHYPDQVIRYSRGGEPLLIAKEPLPSDIPNCEYCGAPRQFEFQIMPQLLSELKENDLDWGVLLVYTCINSCIGESVNSYKQEYIFKQDITNIDNI